MTYSESAVGIEIDFPRAVKELKQHCITDSNSIELMKSEVFQGAVTVSAEKLLKWLGY